MNKGLKNKKTKNNQGSIESRGPEARMAEEAVHCEEGHGLPPQDRNVSAQNTVWGL